MPHSILIVDDSALIRHSLRSCIEQNGNWEVCGEAENGKIGVGRVKELRPDVVILDLQMPVMDGLEAGTPDFPAGSEDGYPDVYDLQLRATFERGSGRWHQKRSLKI
jgi:hypothetical protein